MHFFAYTETQAQNIPVILGGVLETGSGLLEGDNYGTGIVRITPFAGVWLNGLGFARLGFSVGSQENKDSLEAVSKEFRRFDFSAQLGVSMIGAERPYIAVSYIRSREFAPLGDSNWNEWGLGIGHRFTLSPYAAIVIEAEHRWIMEHYDPVLNENISGTRLQMNFGLVVYPY
ncbi:hypothetical protein AGMMS49938_10030 [Fibrobacterales bacterium]|nr:hypothetical protein AGMMS49938_10030 [Fibrobacterales bacterium]